MKKKRLLFLLGLMGSGKSTLGRLLARKLGWNFRDTDALVERKTRRTVAEIFRLQGEPRFRQLESQALRRACGAEPAVVATGGGLPMLPRNRRLMAAQGLTVFLKVPQAELWRRLSRQSLKKRPLLASGRSALRTLAKKRNPIYAGAQITVSAKGSPSQVLKRILAQVDTRFLAC